MSDDLCGCGLPLHYVDVTAERSVRRLVERKGPLVAVEVPGGNAWWVPRHYIALHGLKEKDLPLLAEIYGWKRA